MRDIYSTLKDTKYFIDNEFLLKYCQLIERNTRTQTIRRSTHKHHIIPRSWFKLNNCSVNDDLNNLVNLPTREHFLAHYYLCLCTEYPFRYANQLALMCLMSDKHIKVVDKMLLSSLPLYNNIYEEYIAMMRSNYKLYSEEHLK